jgi:hypothetical protein
VSRRIVALDDQVRSVAVTMYQAACGRIFIMGAPGEWITSRSDDLPTRPGATTGKRRSRILR